MAYKILLVDDDRVTVEVTKNALKARNYGVVAAYDGKEGLEKARSENPDMIILDIRMPEMNGYEFMRALRASKVIEKKPMPPVIMLTAREEMEDMFKLEGAKEYLVKPVESSNLIQKIEKYLNPNE